MKNKVLLFVPFLAACAGCATDADVAGMYVPSCVAFEGSTIELTDRRFTWDKFTDEVTVDAEGNKLDPFPGFPVRGTYTIEDDELRLTTDVGELAAVLHLVRRPQPSRSRRADGEAGVGSGDEEDA
mgnify:CR=1 FL=1